ncbi:MAG: 3-deoxy-manno-octulosonate-8-phosphatase KdsC [Pantoea sp. Brub]|nr:3-deoxy-manno-octulosonate-8-phosphatase KdsC [Pantoea sp. Brub]
MLSENNFIETCYGPVSKHIITIANKIKLLICDVDGVMSDGIIYIGNNGEELKAFHVRDGYGIRSLLKANLEVAVITGRTARSVENRCNILGINHLYQGQSNKLLAYYNLLNKLSLCNNQVSYIGDDLIDLPVMNKVGLSVTVPNAHPLLLSNSHYITYISGGYGAVRELCDIILIAQNKFNYD